MEPALVSKILLVIKSPPYGSGRAAEGFRMATAMIAMDVLPQVLFVDDGVYCLLKSQKPEASGFVSFTERLKTLADLVGLNALSDSLFQRKLKSNDLEENFNVKTLSITEVAELISQNEAVITF
jgi:sulfur relay (sulfurtransferase) DsrF/TusC family protein